MSGAFPGFQVKRVKCPCFSANVPDAHQVMQDGPTALTYGGDVEQRCPFLKFW